MQATDQARVIIDALEPAAAEHDVDIVDVEVVGATKAPCVRVRLDHVDEAAPTITLDELAQHNEWIEKILDELDPITGSYTLEVSSPGLDRPLRRPRDFERFAGEDVQVTTFAKSGRKRFAGRLEGIDGTTVNLTLDDGGPMSFELEEIRRCTIRPDFGSKSRSK